VAGLAARWDGKDTLAVALAVTCTTGFFSSTALDLREDAVDGEETAGSSMPLSATPGIDFIDEDGSGLY